MAFHNSNKKGYTYLQEKQKLLKDFNIRITPDIEEKMIELSDNVVALDNYVRNLIFRRLS